MYRFQSRTGVWTVEDTENAENDWNISNMSIKLLHIGYHVQGGWIQPPLEFVCLFVCFFKSGKEAYIDHNRSLLEQINVRWMVSASNWGRETRKYSTSHETHFFWPCMKVCLCWNIYKTFSIGSFITCSSFCLFKFNWIFLLYDILCIK